MSIAIRRLGPGDEGLVEAFLAPHADSSLFLLGNLRAAGLVDSGAVYSGTWVAALEAGTIVGVAAHCWNGVLLVQAPRALVPLARGALVASGRPLSGLSGPAPQVNAARKGLGLGGARATMEHEADLFSLALADLVVPAPLRSGDVACAPPAAADLPLLARWRAAYALETLGAAPGAALRSGCEEEVRRLAAERNLFVLRAEGVPVAFSAFNARLPDVVQVGGVWTPPELRGRGFARAVVAGSLLSARDDGVARAVLFTERENEPARRAYLALGFRVVGEYGIVLFEAPAPELR